MVGDLRTLYGHRELLLMWTLREIKVRYRQSVLGAAWAILQPLVLMLTFTLIFSVLVRVPSEEIAYPVFAYTGLVAWTFFSSAVTFGAAALVNNVNLVTKTYFPREILPIGSISASLVDLSVASLLLVVLLVLYGISVSATLLWVPVILAIQIMLALGVVLLASAINVFYRDVRFLVPLGVQLWLYATPIIYPLTLVPEKFRLLYTLNPMVGIVDSYRRVILHGTAPIPEYLGISAVVSISLAVIAYAYFKRAEGSFADLI